MSSLFELSAQYQQIMNNIMLNDEISDETMQSLESVNDSLEQKVLNYTSIIKSLECKAHNIEEAIAKMNHRALMLNKGAERLKEIIKVEMQKCDKPKIENEYHEVLLVKNNPRVEFSDKNIIPAEYWRHKVKETLEPDTQAISKALKENVQIPGAYLVRDMRVTIR